MSILIISFKQIVHWKPTTYILGYFQNYVRDSIVKSSKDIPEIHFLVIPRVYII